MNLMTAPHPHTFTGMQKLNMQNEMLEAPVAQLMRRAAAQAIVPRFRSLAARDIDEKAPGELVTAADREAEAMLTEGLSALRPTHG